MSNKHYDIKILQDYLAGKLDPSAMHALERQALEDPLLADALEGLAANPDLQAGDLQSVMQRLAARLDNRVAGLEEQAPEIPVSGAIDMEKAALDEGVPVTALYGKRTGNRFKWWSVAAVLILLLAGGWFYFAVTPNGGNPGPDTSKLIALNGRDTGAVASAIQKVLADTVGNNHLAVGEVREQKQGKASGGGAVLHRENKAETALTPEKEALLERGRIALAKKAPSNEMAAAAEAAPPAAQMAVANALSSSSPLAINKAPDSLGTLLSSRLTAAADGRLDSNAPVGLAGDIAFGERLAGAQARLQTQAKGNTLLSQEKMKAESWKGPEAAAFLKKNILPGAEKADSLLKLDEVVVVGYGRQRKKSVTGAVASANNIAIRGHKMIADTVSPGRNNQPLIILDGKAVEYDTLNKIDPNNIERISVLKGSAATAVYGMRGDNGVILVTTKKKPAGNLMPKDSGIGAADKLAMQRNLSVSSLLQGKIPGLQIVDGSQQTSLLKVHITRISGHLKPAGGIVALKRYLEKRVAEDLWQGKISRYDTGKVYFNVHLESKDYGRGVVIKRSTRDRIFPWLFEAISGPSAPDWLIDKGYTGKDADGPTKIMVEISTK